MIAAVHTFFAVLEETLRGAKVPPALSTGRLRFVVLGPQPERWLVDLDHSACRLRPDEAAVDAELTLFCDAPQLERMLTEGVSERPLRFDGNEALIDSLAAAMKPARSVLDVRAGATDRGE